MKTLCILLRTNAVNLVWPVYKIVTKNEPLTISSIASLTFPCVYVVHLDVRKMNLLSNGSIIKFTIVFDNTSTCEQKYTYLIPRKSQGIHSHNRFCGKAYIGYSSWANYLLINVHRSL